MGSKDVEFDEEQKTFFNHMLICTPFLTKFWFYVVCHQTHRSSMYAVWVSFILYNLWVLHIDNNVYRRWGTRIICQSMYTPHRMFYTTENQYITENQYTNATYCYWNLRWLYLNNISFFLVRLESATHWVVCTKFYQEGILLIWTTSTILFSKLAKCM